MDPETALNLTRFGGAFLLLDIPIGTEFGIDLSVYRCGPLFKGIKMVPPGDSSARTNFFTFTKGSDVLVRKWDADIEQVVPMDQDEAERYRLGVRRLEFDSGLGPYQLDKYREWQTLSSHITEEVIEHIQITAIPTAKEPSISTADESEQVKGHGTLSFTTIPPRTTEFDRTWMLEEMARRAYGGKFACLLGELQAAFIACLLGQDFDAFDQWKHLVDLFCSCDRAPDAHPKLYLDFVLILRGQLAQLPMDWFADLISGNTFLAKCLSALMQICYDSTNEELSKACEKLAAYVKKRFNWDIFVDEEDAPEIVNEDEVTL